MQVEFSAVASENSRMNPCSVELVSTVCRLQTPAAMQMTVDIEKNTSRKMLR